VNVKDRLAEIDVASPVPWVEFLEYSGGANSPYYRYLFHQEVVIDPVRDRVYLVGGQGVGFEYTFERYYHEVREVLTDAKAFQFFQMYDLYGPGFASLGGWAKNKLSAAIRGIYFSDDTSTWSTKPGVAKAIKYDPNPPAPAIPEDIPEREAFVRGETVYRAQCTPCHGSAGDGKGFLAAGFDVQPRDFRQGTYKFRSTKTGELPAIEDVERIVRVGVPNSTMPAWGQFLTEEQIKDVSRYLVVFSGRFLESWKENKKPDMLEVPSPPGNLEALVSKGKKLYETGRCDMCHGASGLGNGPSAPGLRDEWGYPIEATDLTYKWLFKNGHAPEDIYRTFNGGLNGTPMPSYLDVFSTDEERWALVAYVLSLSPGERPVLRLSEYKQ
jgi:mono/diheme cytochrome c family protein